MRSCSALALCCALCLLCAGWAWSQPLEGVRRLSAKASLTANPGEDERSLHGPCYQRAREELLAQAADYFAGLAQSKGLELKREELLALADGLTKAEVERERLERREGKLVYSLSLFAEYDSAKVGEKIAWLAEHPEIKAKITAARRKINAEAAKLNQAREAPAESRARERAEAALEQIEAERASLARELSAVSKAAREYLRPGFSEQEVRRVLGEPAMVKSGGRGFDFICLNYGQTWAVLYQGRLACLRKNLEYRNYYGSDCHCAGDVSSFVESGD